MFSTSFNVVMSKALETSVQYLLTSQNPGKLVIELFLLASVSNPTLDFFYVYSHLCIHLCGIQVIQFNC